MLTPSRVAAAAPGKATTESVWPAKVWRRSTMNQPTRRGHHGDDRAGLVGVDHELVGEQAARIGDQAGRPARRTGGDQRPQHAGGLVHGA